MKSSADFRASPPKFLPFPIWLKKLLEQIKKSPAFVELKFRRGRFIELWSLHADSRTIRRMQKTPGYEKSGEYNAACANFVLRARGFVAKYDLESVEKMREGFAFSGILSAFGGVASFIASKVYKADIEALGIAFLLAGFQLVERLVSITRTHEIALSAASDGTLPNLLPDKTKPLWRRF